MVNCTCFFFFSLLVFTALKQSFQLSPLPFLPCANCVPVRARHTVVDHLLEESEEAAARCQNVSLSRSVSTLTASNPRDLSPLKPPLQSAESSEFVRQSERTYINIRRIISPSAALGETTGPGSGGKYLLYKISFKCYALQDHGEIHQSGKTRQINNRN